MTTYGTIPAGPAAEGRRDFVAVMKGHGRNIFSVSTHRPWRELAPSIHAFSFPRPFFSEVFHRVRSNGAHFAANYTIIVLIVVFLSLIRQPVSLIVFLVMVALWLFLFFLRDDPVAVMNREFSDRTVMIVLSIATLVVLLLTGATTNIIVSLVVGIVVVLVHAAFRKTEDLEGGGGGYYAVPGDEEQGPGRNPR